MTNDRSLQALSLEIRAAQEEDRPILRRLLELYRHDASEFDHREIGPHGEFGYPYLDHYWTDSDRHPFLIRADGHLAGFALVRSGLPHDMTEFFILKKYRRSGVGLKAAHEIFGAFPGQWQVRERRENTSAILFWRRVIEWHYTEADNEEGPVQSFSVPD